MKETLSIVIVFLASFLLSSFSINKTYDLQVKIKELQNSKGEVIVMIYNKDGSIPDKTFTHYWKKTHVIIKNNEAFAVFEDIPAGRYAINIFHDENLNGALDKGFLLPKEGFGLSNFKSVNLFNKPNFKRASFIFKKDTTVEIKTIYL